MSFEDILKSGVVGSAIGSVADIAGSLIQNTQNREIMREQQKFAAEQAQLERDFAASQMQAQMGYNSPVNQLSMMRGAGLNVMGDSVNPMSATPTSGAAAVAPGSPQMTMNMGTQNLANLIGAMAQLNASEASQREAGVAESKAPSEISKNEADVLNAKEQANLASAQAVQTDYMRRLLGAQVSAETQNTLVNTEKVRLESSFLPRMLASQIGLNETQRQTLVDTVANQLASIRAQIAIAKINAGATMYSADQNYKVGYGNVLLRKAEWETGMSQFNRQFGLEKRKFEMDFRHTLHSMGIASWQQAQLVRQYERQFEGLGLVWNTLFGSPAPLSGLFGIMK